MSGFLQSRFQLACAAFLAALGLLVFHQIDSAQWVSTTTWVLGLYFSSQVAETAVTKKPPDTPV
jgi:hypothetical protein